MQIHTYDYIGAYLARTLGGPKYCKGSKSSTSQNLRTSYTQWPVSVGGQTTSDGRGLQPN